MTLSLRRKIYLLLGWMLLISVPAMLLLTHTAMFPLISLNSFQAEGLYWLTSSGTAPFGVLTVLVLLGLCFRQIPKAHFLPLFITVSISMVSTLALNQFLKPYFSEPRPNAQLLHQQQLLNINEFYQLAPAQRKPVINDAVNQFTTDPHDVQLSPLIANHWRNEVGFAFPSGHTLFAVTLSMVMSYFLLLSGQYLLPSLLCLWSLGMGFSRMLLGMHWSQDVLASTVIGGLIGLACIWGINRCWPRLATLIATLTNTKPLTTP
ncbi:phosphatase PAP2 family protein [Shewanella colwelliana]|nr:phosphatase PAP2 family protein [Shewanella colwelliana]